MDMDKDREVRCCSVSVSVSASAYVLIFDRSLQLAPPLPAPEPLLLLLLVFEINFNEFSAFQPQKPLNRHICKQRGRKTAGEAAETLARLSTFLASQVNIAHTHKHTHFRGFKYI